MRGYFNKITGLNPSKEFAEIIDEFGNKFGNINDGIDMLGQYVGFTHITNKSEVRAYELVPFEAELPFSTGSNGEHMGWLNLCPELTNFKKPFITWVPLGGHIFYHGTDKKEFIQNLIKSLYEEEYENIDLEFLNELGIDPKNGKESILINYDNEPLNKIPLNLDFGWNYEITLDGVGVVAENVYYSPKHNELTDINDFDKNFQHAKETLEAGYYATSLCLLKNSYFKGFYDNNFNKNLIEILKLKYKCYNSLKKYDIALIVEEEINKWKQNS